MATTGGTSQIKSPMFHCHHFVTGPSTLNMHGTFMRKVISQPFRQDPKETKETEESVSKSVEGMWNIPICIITILYLPLTQHFIN